MIQVIVTIFTTHQREGFEDLNCTLDFKSEKYVSQREIDISKVIALAIKEATEVISRAAGNATIVEGKSVAKAIQKVTEEAAKKLRPSQ